MKQQFALSLVAAALILMVSVNLTGCTRSESPAATQASATETPLAENETVSAETYEDNFAVDISAATAFAQRIQQAVADRDLEALADLTAFPVYVGLPEVGVVETRDAFLRLDSDAVFSPALTDAIAQADITHFQPSMAGFNLSAGSTADIIFGVVNGTLAITGINY